MMITAIMTNAGHIKPEYFNLNPLTKKSKAATTGMMTETVIRTNCNSKDCWSNTATSNFVINTVQRSGLKYMYEDSTNLVHPK